MRPLDFSRVLLFLRGLICFNNSIFYCWTKVWLHTSEPQGAWFFAWLFISSITKTGRWGVRRNFNEIYNFSLGRVSPNRFEKRVRMLNFSWPTWPGTSVVTFCLAPIQWTCQRCYFNYSRPHKFAPFGVPFGAFWMFNVRRPCFRLFCFTISEIGKLQSWGT